MLKFGLEIALRMIQKSDAAIFEILIFRNFSGGQSPNFGPNRGGTQFFKKLVIIKNIMLNGQLIFSKIIFYFGQFTLDK